MKVKRSWTGGVRRLSSKIIAFTVKQFYLMVTFISAWRTRSFHSLLPYLVTMWRILSSIYINTKINAWQLRTGVKTTYVKLTVWELQLAETLKKEFFSLKKRAPLPKKVPLHSEIGTFVDEFSGLNPFISCTHTKPPKKQKDENFRVIHVHSKQLSLTTRLHMACVVATILASTCVCTYSAWKISYKLVNQQLIGSFFFPPPIFFAVLVHRSCLLFVYIM